MAYKEVIALDAEVTISLGGVNKKTGRKNPTEVEGYYLGSRSIEDRKKKSGLSYIYFFQTANGNIGVWGKTDLDKKMASAVVGAMTKVLSTGQRETPNGPMYTYKLLIDDTNRIYVPNTLSSAAATETTSDSGATVGYDEDEAYAAETAGDEDDGLSADEEDAAQEAALAAAAKTAAERKAKVQALLGKNKKT